MTKPLPSWTYGLLTFCGVVLIGSMFVTWIDAFGSHTGFGLAWNDNAWLFLVPLAGVALATTAAMRSEATRLAAIAAGIAISGYVLFHFAKSIVLDGGVASWLLFGGAGAILAGVPGTRRSWRVIGGLAVLAGFFAPWDDHSTFSALRSENVDWLVDAGVTVRVLWLIPAAGLAAIASATAADAKSARLALVSGLAVLVSILWFVGSLANLVLAWGAWSALGASAVALAIGVFGGVRKTA